MWRFLVLSVAVALASGFDEENPPTPVFSKRYTMRFDLTDYTDVHFSSYTVWFDNDIQKGRTDRGDVKQVKTVPSEHDKQGTLDLTFPVTTETNELKSSCVHIVDEKEDYIIPIDYLSVTTGSKFIGKERVHAQDAYMWRLYYVLHGLSVEIVTAVVYTGKTNDENEASAIPLRMQIKMWHNKFGIIVLYTVQDFYDYKPLEKIDPEIWDINKGITCKEINDTEISSLMFGNMEPFYQFMNLLGNHEGSKQMTKNFEKFIERRIGQKLDLSTTEDSTQSSSEAYGDPAPAPENALPFPYSESEIEEMSRKLPEELDWRVRGAVTPVKNSWGLDICHSSWAFSATGAIEAFYYLKTGRYHVMWLSEQALIDCTWGFGNNGCFGGRPEHAFDWVKKYGIPSGVRYRQYNFLNNACNLTDVVMSVNITGYTRVPQSEDALRVALNTYGPLSAEIQVGHFGWYSGGIYKDKCESKKTIFVLVVGYGVLDGEKYWIIKNSSGTNWGANGYLYLAAKNNLCGIQNSVYYVQ